MFQRGFGSLAIVLVVVGVLVTALGFYEVSRALLSQDKAAQPASNPPTTPHLADTTSTASAASTSLQCQPGQCTATSSTLSTAGWAMYTSAQYGFSFEYPQGLEVSDGGPYTSRSGTQPDSLDDISVYTSSYLLFDIQVFSPGIVQGDYGWPERPCGEWAFGPDNGPVSSEDTMFAGEKTLYLISRGFGDYSPTSSFVIYDYYCVNYPENPIVITFNQVLTDQVQPILSTFEFSNSPASSASL